MNKLLLSLAVLTVFSAPALASYPRVQNEREVHHGVSKRAHQYVLHMRPLWGERGSDPYWAPCDYTTTADPNGCE
jgi:hypothetical protein